MGKLCVLEKIKTFMWFVLKQKQNLYLRLARETMGIENEGKKKKWEWYEFFNKY